MSYDEKHLLFETYKLHAELAERVASLREGFEQALFWHGHGYRCSLGRIAPACAGR